MILNCMENSIQENKYSIPMLEKAFELIELLSKSTHGFTMSEIIQILNQPKTSVYRLLNSLTEMGYISKSEENSHYFLSKKLLKIGLGAVGDSNLIEYAIPFMQKLRNCIKESIMLGVLIEDKVVLLEQVLGSYNFAFILRPGTKFNLHSSAPGKLFLSFTNEIDRDYLLKSIEYKVYNKNTISNYEQMKKEIKVILKQGYSLDIEEEMTGVNCVAAPIFNNSGKVIAAIWTSGPSGRLTKEIFAEIAKEIIKTANKISTNLGYN